MRSIRLAYLLFSALLVCLVAVGTASAQFAGGGFGRGGFGGGGFGGGFGVGGISIDADGIVATLSPQASESLAAERRKLLAGSPIAGRDKSGLRKVSLARLCERLKAAVAAAGDPPKNGTEKQAEADLVDLLLLGGLERISYVLVDPERNDIVLAGPADKGVIDGKGNVVAAGSGRPLMRLEDLVIAMASIDRARNGGIRCSIDPTPEGIAKLRAFLADQRAMGPDSDVVLRGMEQAVGMQNVSVGGVPSDSRFAQVLVAADYKLKRIGMGLEPSGLREVPSYLSMVPSGAATSALPRFWLEPAYEPLIRDPDELAWKFPGRSMKCLSESDAFDGKAVQRGKAPADPSAAKWCERFSANYDELAAKHPIFRDLDNCVDLAVVAALIHARQLDARAGIDLSILKDPSKLGLAKYQVPSKVQTVATGTKKGGRWVLSASGGVLVQPWEIASKVFETPDAAKPRLEALAGRPAAGWWWD